MIKHLPPLFAEAIVNSVKEVYSKCVELGLGCIDPPSVITPLLRRLGYSEYQIRRFWHFFEGLGGSIAFEIYHYLSIRFNLLLSYRKEMVMHLREECIPLDELDCQRVGSKCVRTPHSHALYIYIEGRMRNTTLCINVVRVLRLLYLRNPRLTNELMDVLINVIWKRTDISELYDRVLKTLRLGSDILQFILPYIPTTLKDLLELSPTLRRIAIRIQSRKSKLSTRAL